jgi:hypothetical protein
MTQKLHLGTAEDSPIWPKSVAADAVNVGLESSNVGSIGD